MKKDRIVLIILGILIIAAAGYLGYKEIKGDQSIVNTKQINLTPEERKVAEDRLNQAKQQVMGLNESSDAQTRFGAYMQLGFAYQLLGQLADAKDAFDNALKANYQPEKAYVTLYGVEAEMGDYRGAEQDIKNAINIQPDKADYWKKLIDLKKDLVKADNRDIDILFNQALENTNESADILSYYAQFLEQQGNLDGALLFWQKALEREPSKSSQYQPEIDRIKALIKK